MPSKKIIKISQNIVLIFASIAFSLVLAEIVLRLTNLGKYSLYDRTLFFTAPSLVQGKDKTVKYEPKTDIRSVAIYGDQVDYDITYGTNNLGFVDNVDYDFNLASTKKIVFIGDSFTAGDGSNYTWVSQLRQLLDRPDINLYNFGVTGTGIKHFQQLLASVKDTVRFNEINIMVIGNDFFRPLWYPVVQGQALWFCSQENAQDCVEKYPPVIYTADKNESQTELINRAKQLYETKNLPEQSKPNFLQQFRLYNLICDLYSLGNNKPSSLNLCPHLRFAQANEYDKNELYKDSLTTLQEIKDSFPDAVIRVVHIPEKGEIFNNKYSLEIRDDIKQMGLEYVPLLEICPWNRDMYHKHDAHFNDLGYRNLTNCIWENLF
ncbi:SGNH/GDSL hydrolase family protein [Synechocystis sp. FACHB-383]|uniref:SGNH/GDSL hydrolase family protein n=1 Tax=Synechocystis sp. FACHB-383 TaxID=2692864 RepID=UPI0016824491|nr:SGNH/GDSL hydrolase family protein [Synechocystis sp. FACHB-383]MBD2653903.1 SGNH/GDSL hydrolase family protein [Synechocystis sp. FACHB-383]